MLNTPSLDNWKLFLALQDASAWMSDYGHRMNPQFHQPLGEVVEVAFDGFTLDFSDPGLQALFQVIDFTANSVEQSIADLVGSLCHWAAVSKSTGIHVSSRNSALDNLASFRNSAGWTHIDAMLQMACGITLSSFFNNVKLSCCEDDPGLGGDVCYSLSLSSRWGNSGMPWYGLASTPDRAIRLLGEACAGAHNPDLPDNKRAVPKDILSVAIDCNGERVLFVQMGKGEDLRPNWKTLQSKIPTLDLVKMLAGHAPEEAIYRLKGVILEDDLGL